MDFDAMVEDLAVEHRKDAALRALMDAGPRATDAVRRGLQHDEPIVRVRCCVVLDHFLDEAAIPELIANLEHPSASVREWALHALACDRCKEGECRPGEDDVVPIALRMLREDPGRYVRKTAVLMVGAAVHRRRDVVEALVRAHAEDPDPLVRKVAGWFVPGGPIYERLSVEERRRSRAASSAS